MIRPFVALHFRRIADSVDLVLYSYTLDLWTHKVTRQDFVDTLKFHGELVEGSTGRTFVLIGRGCRTVLKFPDGGYGFYGRTED